MQEVGRKLGKSTWSIRSIMKRKNILRRPSNITKSIQYQKSPLSFQPKFHLSNQEEKLKIAGLMLYWAEGSKKNTKGIDFANSDPKMITLFIAFLRQIYTPNESRFRIYLYTHNKQNIKEQINYWSEITNIPTSQFTKPYIHRNQDPKHDKMPHGLIHIRYSDKRLLELIISDLEKIKSWDGRVVKYTSL